MTDLEFKKFLNDRYSESFCAAKYYNATIWLGSGMTTSCHHPPAHYVPVEDIIKNPKALHNTPKKKEDRKMMKHGLRPDGCEYCWKIEDMGPDAISDRIYKSNIYNFADLKQAFITTKDTDVNLKTLEISFDRTCNFACSYCNPAFSTTWARDISSNGAYMDLVSDGRNHFTHTHSDSQRYKPDEDNPYVEAFFKWWDSDLHASLQELRITGGEPLLSPHTWRLFDWYAKEFVWTKTKLAINSNLCNPQVNKFIERLDDLPPIDLYTSCEAMDKQAEYIRGGLDWDEWNTNVERMLSGDQLRGFHVMCTINALCLDTLPQFLDHLVSLRQKHTTDLSFTLNILRFPSFQSPLVLPHDIRMKYVHKLEEWLTVQIMRDTLKEMEINHIKRLLEYLDVVETPHSETFEQDKLENDFKHFYQQYDQRRGHNFVETFPALATWYNSL